MAAAALAVVVTPVVRAAALIALRGGYGFGAVTNPFTGGVIALAPFGGVLTVLWIVGITNAFNLIDGPDGVAAAAFLGLRRLGYPLR